MSLFDSGRRNRILDALLAGVEDDDAWKAALTSLAEVLRADVVSHHTYDHRLKKGVLTPILGLDPEDVLAYEVYYGQLNVWVIHGRHLIKPGGLTVSHHMYPQEKLVRTEFFNDWLRGAGIGYVVSAVLQFDDLVAQSISFCRAPAYGAYTPEEQAFLQQLVAPLERAQRLRRRLASASGCALSDTVLDRLSTGVVLLDERGAILDMNQAARAMVAAGDGVKVHAERLTAILPESRKALAAALTAAVSLQSQLRAAGLTVQVARPSGRAPYEVWVTPFSGSTPQGAMRALAFIADPGRDRVTEERTLRELYGLTRAEARVALGLLQGGSLEEVATALHLSRETVRSHLRSILRKTGARRQGEFIRRVLTGIVPLLPSPAAHE